MVAQIGRTNTQPLNGQGGISNDRDAGGAIGGLPFDARSGATRASGRSTHSASANNAVTPSFTPSPGAPARNAAQAATTAPETHTSFIAPTHTAQVYTAGAFVDTGSPTSPAASSTSANDTQAAPDAQTASQTTSHEPRKGSSLRKKLHTALKFAGAAVVIGGAATAVAAAATALATPVLLAGLGVAIGGVIVLTVNHFTRPGQA